MIPVPCPICDSSKTVLKENRLNLYFCNSCLHTFTGFPKQVEKYDEEYFMSEHKKWFDNPNYELFDFIYDEAVKRLGGDPVHLLDVGCGTGDFLKYIVNKNESSKLTGIDLIDNQHPGVLFLKGSFLEENLDAEFNVICSLGVIEHIDTPKVFVKKTNDLLRPGGLLFIMTINNDGFIYRIARLLNKLGIHFAHDKLYSFHHIQHFTNRSIKTLVEKQGFDVLIQKNHNYPIKAVDVPKSNVVFEKIYTFSVWLIFLLSAPLGGGMLQTVVCRKRNS
jgi:2-polyprenyl-3-methyl-5-hydroxy-6-metoxy-1,4-benzoquinol methylase